MRIDSKRTFAELLRLIIDDFREVESAAKVEKPRSQMTAPTQPLRAPTGNHRLENWKDLRAFLRPYFLRSTTRGSRVRKPACFRIERSSGS